MRVDKFLKVCRLIKRRTVAAEACEGERISVNGKTAKPSKDIKLGDIVEIAFGNRTLRVRVLSIEETVKKEAAAEMYEVIE
ncbi:RNA-binding S4 domain-containing protein [bacterium]|nr:RNA-binding S4 domain-containing protein [bacterium]